MVDSKTLSQVLRIEQVLSILTEIEIHAKIRGYQQIKNRFFKLTGRERRSSLRIAYSHVT